MKTLGGTTKTKTKTTGGGEGWGEEKDIRGGGWVTVIVLVSAVSPFFFLEFCDPFFGGEVRVGG